MFNKLFGDLTHEEKLQLISMILLSLFTIIVILFAFLVSRGQDVEYFKSRIDIIDQRSLYMDQKIDKVNEKMAITNREINDIKRRDDEQQREIEEHRKWVEYWKTLPQLPKPSRGNVPR